MRPIVSLQSVFRSFLVFAAAGTSFSEPVRREWIVAGITREALVHTPANARNAPLVLVFHGHGGTMRNAARTFNLHTLWPEAVIVYPQGLKTPGRLTDPQGQKSGWQHAAGDQDDRDLAWVDALLTTLTAEGKVDPKRVYATGHSNGGAFTYLLWAERGEAFAAFAPSAAALGRPASGSKRRPPRPLLHIAGQADPLVKFTWQQGTIAAARLTNGCNEIGQPWPEGGTGATLYPSRLGAPVVTLIHPGGHTFLNEAPRAIVRFFQDHPRP